MQQLPKFVGTMQDKIFQPSKDLIKSQFNKSSKHGDKDRLIEDEETDELDLDKEKNYTTSNMASFGSSKITAASNKMLTLSDKCVCCRCSKRWQLAILANIGFIIVFGIRCNIGAAKVRMTHNFTDTEGVKHTPVVNWDAQILGVIEGAFFYGYLITQLPGGFISARFPANKLFGLAIGLASFFNLFMPGACSSGYGFVVFIQILQGLVQGVAYPAMHGVWRYWAPPLERTKLATTAFTGSYAGAVIGLPLSAVMVSGLSWQAPFYLYGNGSFFIDKNRIYVYLLTRAAGCIWFVFWWLLTFETPGTHPTITEAERIHIETSIGHTAHVIPTISNVPWKAILTSKCVWAIIVANFCRSWTFYLLLIHQLSYMKDVLKMEIKDSGFWAAMPHAVMSIVVLIGGQIADLLRQRQILSTTAVRKIFNCGGFGMEALFLIICAYTRNKAGAIASLIFAVGFSGFAISGFNVNHLDIAPRYASILMGMSNGMGTFSGMICPAVTERLTKTYGIKGWETVFLLAGLIHLTGVTFYAIFASGEKQPWAEPPEEEEKWKPDDFAGKASQAGLGGYGATEAVNIQPLPTKDDILLKRTDYPQNSYYTNGPDQAKDAWGDYDSAKDYQKSRTGVGNENYYSGY